MAAAGWQSRLAAVLARPFSPDRLLRLHLAGFDHEDDRRARVMERLECDILDGLGYADPYRAETAS